MLRYTLGDAGGTVGFIVYGGGADVFSRLQSVGTAMALLSTETVMDCRPITMDELLADTIAHGHHLGSRGKDGHLLADHRPAPRDYLTPQTIQAIVKSWDITPYNPPGMNVSSWLGRVRKLCEEYGVPVTQRALCAMHHMRADCREEAHTAECYDMTWDQFTTWLLQYDGVYHFEVPFLVLTRLLDVNRTSVNSNYLWFSYRKRPADLWTPGRVTELLAKPKV